MTADLMTWALTAHTVILPAAILGFYRSSDRSDRFAKSVGIKDDQLSKMRSVITCALEDHLEPVFLRADSEPILVLPDAYRERAVNPVGSERYREALRAFIDANIPTVAEYGRACRAKRQWHRWAIRQDCLTLGLVIWEIICVGLLGSAEPLFKLQLSDFVTKITFGPTILLIISFVVCQIILLRQSVVIDENTQRYHDF
jgi:hypothetical protein